MKKVYNEKAIYLGKVYDESYLWEYEYEEYNDVIIVLNTNQSIDEYLKMFVCHSN